MNKDPLSNTFSVEMGGLSSSDKKLLIDACKHAITQIKTDNRLNICRVIKDIIEDEGLQKLKPYINKYKPEDVTEGFWYLHNDPEAHLKRIQALENTIKDLEE